MFLFLSFTLIVPVDAKDFIDVTVYLFYGDGCPHCASEKEFLTIMRDKSQFIGKTKLPQDFSVGVVFCINIS